MEFEEVAAHFGYSLGVGAIPVKKFGYHGQAPRRPQEAHAKSCWPSPSLKHLVAALSEAGRARSKASPRSASSAT